MTPPLGAGVLHLAFSFAGLGAVQGIAPPDLDLAWSAPDECPDREELTSRVSRLLGGVVKSNLTAETEVTHSAGVYRARLRVKSSAGSGERVLENAQCDVLADSVALVIALSASPLVDSSQLEDAHDEQSERLAIAASAHASVLFGPLPHPAAGFGGALAIEGVSSLRFELRGTYYLHQSTTFDQSTLGGRFGLVTAGARGCRIWSFGALDLGPCVGAEIYFVTANGFGGMVSQEQEASWWGPALGVFGRVRVATAFGLYVVADGVLPLSTRDFVFSDVGLLHHPSAVALQILVAPEVRF